MPAPTPPTRSSHLMLPWPAVALGSFVLAVSAGVVIVIVTQSDQTLSTVAIILAIIAFLVQIIVFIVQMQVANQQALQSQTIFGDMQTTLGTIQERTDGTQQSLMGLNERLMEAALGKALPQAQKASVGSPDEFVRDTAERLVRILREGDADASEPEDGGGRFIPDYPLRISDPKDSVILNQLSTFPPPDSARDSIAVLRTLPDPAVQRFAQLVQDEKTSRSPGSPLAPGLPANPLDSSLIDKGLVTDSDTPMADGARLRVLTEQGRERGRLLTADGPVPEGVDAELVSWLRQVAAGSAA